MKTYRVHFTFHHAGYFDIVADSAEEAEELATAAFEESDDYTFKEGQGFQTFGVEAID